jgi:predicted ABC-type ATPase
MGSCPRRSTGPRGLRVLSRPQDSDRNHAAAGRTSLRDPIHRRGTTRAQLRDRARTFGKRCLECAVLTVIAGPNGAGKTTLTKVLDFEGRENLLDPDAIARQINPLNPHNVRVAAGRENLRRLQNCMVKGVSFAIETTLASKRTLVTMQAAKDLGFRLDLVYIGLDTSERCIVRVQERVLQSGHDVPDDDVRRRYIRSLANLPEAIRIADRAVVTIPRMRTARCLKSIGARPFGARRTSRPG